MPEVQRSALVPFTPFQMFDLVRDVKHYPDFLPWITGTEIYEDAETHQYAAIHLSIAGVQQRIATKNDLIPGELLRLNLAEGPFKRFSGEWRFGDLGIGCRVELSLGFEFDSPVLVAAFSRGFVSVANRMVDDFTRRAEQLYAR
jgi:ribosome-associated toxin RatA of RatAB toxin-antitoxin module